MTKSKLLSIADVLPDNMSEDAVNKIATLVEEAILDEVSKRIKLLESKVKAYLISKKSEIKESALAELQEESDAFRGLSKYNELKSFMELELNAQDSTTAVGKVVKTNEALEQENAALVEEFNKVIGLAKKYKASNKVLENRIALMETTQNELNLEVQGLLESNSLEVKSSERAVIIADNTAITGKKETTSRVSNPMLTEEVIALMG